MKKKIGIGLGIACLVLVVGGAYAYYKIQGMLPAKEEALQFNQDKVNETINKQLVGVDRQAVRAKADLILEKTIPQIQASIAEGKLTYEELTAFYLDRIQELDQKKDGINSIVEVNPEAMDLARSFDQNENSKESPLYGMPLTLKDNINSKEMPTSAGTHALKDFQPSEDAALVSQLKDAGALILAKVNLSELANYMDPKMPSGYSSKAGQTRNPYGPLRITPAGSSSGSAASITANIGLVSIGSETTGSIVAPAAIQSLVGFKPSKGSVDGEGIFPLASSLDVPGPIARNMTDLVLTYQSLALDQTSIHELDQLPADSLKGKRIGLVKTGHHMTDSLKKQLEAAGAEVVETSFDTDGLDNAQVIDNDFAHDVAVYAQAYDAPIKSLDELVSYNKKDLAVRARYGQGFVEETAKVKWDPQYSQKQVALAKEKLAQAQADKKVDAFVFFNNEAVLLPAMAGAPEITVPFGLNDEGEPQGATFVSLPGDDINLLRLAYSFEQGTKLRVQPQFK